MSGETRERTGKANAANLFLCLDDCRRVDERRVNVDRGHVVHDDRDPEALFVLEDSLQKRRLPGAQETAQEGHGESCRGALPGGESRGLNGFRVLVFRHFSMKLPVDGRRVVLKFSQKQNKNFPGSLSLVPVQAQSEHIHTMRSK